MSLRKAVVTNSILCLQEAYCTATLRERAYKER
jgi:hypothetical protein